MAHPDNLEIRTKAPDNRRRRRTTVGRLGRTKNQMPKHTRLLPFLPSSIVSFRSFCLLAFLPSTIISFFRPSIHSFFPSSLAPARRRFVSPQERPRRWSSEAQLQQRKQKSTGRRLEATQGNPQADQLAPPAAKELIY
eukprot:GHVT01096026.1.p1 GENE.GHVT01096026.1~~GHVT01096026.1.p1  ORF type:complete len:138 (+),score=30.27 GHVT01096026.1:339-752(+)